MYYNSLKKFNRFLAYYQPQLNKLSKDIEIAKNKYDKTYRDIVNNKGISYICRYCGTLCKSSADAYNSYPHVKKEVDNQVCHCCAISVLNTSIYMLDQGFVITCTNMKNGTSKITVKQNDVVIIEGDKM